MATWVRFTYREFYDVPRTILFVHLEHTYLLDSRFQAEADEYDSSYRVYRLARVDPTLPDRLDWTGIEALGEPIGSVDVSIVRFDPTRRASLDIDSLGVDILPG